MSLSLRRQPQKTTSKPKRIITIELPHRETAVPALLVLMLLFAGFFCGVTPYLMPYLRPYMPHPWPAEPTVAPAPVSIPNPQLTNRVLNERVEALLSKMTLDQKIGQLTQYSSGEITGPGGAQK